MGWIPTAISGLSALGGLFGNKSKTETNTPTIDERYRPLLDSLYGLYQNKLSNPNVDLSGYAANGISNINSMFDLAKLNRSNSLTARGLSTSPIAAASDEMGNNSRMGQIVQLQNTIPLIQRQFQNEDQGNAMNLIKTLMGQTSTDPGNMVGGATSSLATTLAYLWGKGAFGNTSNRLNAGMEPS
jgi:hypothetical protein